jgi:hypothetical protein
MALVQFLPNGMSLMVDPDFYDRLHYGDATVGWTGDERLGVYHENGRIELWRHCEDGEMRLIVRSRPGMDRLDASILKFLAEHDSQSRRGYNAADEIVAAAVKAEYERAKKEADRSAEMADRLRFGLMRDVGATEGDGSTRDFHTLPEAPWTKDKNDAQDAG